MLSLILRDGRRTLSELFLEGALMLAVCVVAVESSVMGMGWIIVLSSDWTGDS